MEISENYLQNKSWEALHNLGERNSESRKEKRDFFAKLATLCLTILGFSLTLFSANLLSDLFSNGISLFFLFVSWTMLLFSVVACFVFLKLESDFQDGQYTTQSLFANDNAEILDSNLNIKSDKKNDWIALRFLENTRVTENNFWTQEAKDIFESHRGNLQSWRLVNKPEKFYSYSHRKRLLLIEKITYVLVPLALLLMVIGVGIGLACIWK